MGLVSTPIPVTQRGAWGAGPSHKLTEQLCGGQGVDVDPCRQGGDQQLLGGRGSSSGDLPAASWSKVVIDFALEDFMTLLEIIKRTNIKFSQTKSIASFFHQHGEAACRSSE